MEIQEPKHVTRRWWQFHLSSKVVGLLAVWFFLDQNSEEYRLKDVSCFGWPFEWHSFSLAGQSWHWSNLWMDLGTAIGGICALLFIWEFAYVREWLKNDASAESKRHALRFHFSTLIFFVLVLGACMAMILWSTPIGNSNGLGWPRMWHLEIPSAALATHWIVLLYDLYVAFLLSFLVWHALAWAFGDFKKPKNAARDSTN